MADLNYNLVFWPGRSGFWFIQVPAIDSEHSQKGPYQFSGTSKQFEEDVFFAKLAKSDHRLVGRLVYHSKRLETADLAVISREICENFVKFWKLGIKENASELFDTLYSAG